MGSRAQRLAPADDRLPRFLGEARVKRGERLLVHGAASGVGSAALQLGRFDGLELYGPCSAGDPDVVASLARRRSTIGRTDEPYRTLCVVALKTGMR